MKKLFFTFIGLAMTFSASAQGKLLTMEEAIIGRHLAPKNIYVQWQGNRDVATYLEDGNLVADAVTGDKKVLLSLGDLNAMLGAELKGWPNYSWKDAATLVVRHAQRWIEIDVEGKKIVSDRKLCDKAQNLKSNGRDLIAYTKANNLYYMDALGHEFAVTENRDRNIVSGQFVSRNEFNIADGIFWSPDGKKLAFYQKDESEVTNFPLFDINSRTGKVRNIKYPMAGMKSEQVSLGVYDIASGKTTFMQVDDFGREQYLTNIAWDPASEKIYIQVLDRAQKHMHLNRYDAQTGACEKTLLTEQSTKYVEPFTPVVFLKNDPSKFIYRTNSRDGFFSLYLVEAASGKVLKRLTDVDADVAMVGQDSRYIYYTSAEVSPIDNHLFRVDVKSGKKTRLTKEEGWHNITMSKNATMYVDNYNALNVPRVINFAKNNGETLKNLLTAENPTADYNYGEITIGSLKSADGKFDNYYRLIKPINFDPAKKYPTILYVYGGPHAQLVRNVWTADMARWEMLMAQKGYVVFVMDNRGTPNRGLEYEQAIHGQCGQCEMADQMEGIKFLKSQPWVDADRIGVHGWSYGGFMTISLTTNFPETFKVAVAGGPVIDWKWYEVMYGERYMDSPHVNPEGYEKVSLIRKAKDLKSKLLICQGVIDPVVVCEHSLSFVRECVKNNVQVDYFPYPCHEHNVRGKDRIHLMQKVTDYFEDYLK